MSLTWNKLHVKWALLFYKTQSLFEWVQLNNLSRRDNEDFEKICKQETINNEHTNCTLRSRTYTSMTTSSLINFFNLQKARSNKCKKLDLNQINIMMFIWLSFSDWESITIAMSLFNSNVVQHQKTFRLFRQALTRLVWQSPKLLLCTKILSLSHLLYRWLDFRIALKKINTLICF